MRLKLKSLLGEKHRFVGTVDKFGKSIKQKTFNHDTVMFKDIKLAHGKTVLTDHNWFVCGKNIQELDLVVGDIVEFDALVVKYYRGYINKRKNIDTREWDYRLSRIKSIIKK